MRWILILTIGLLASLSFAAQADVVYHWQPTYNSGAVAPARAVNGQLIVSNRAYRAGHLSFSYRPGGKNPGIQFKHTPDGLFIVDPSIISVRLWFTSRFLPTDRYPSGNRPASDPNFVVNDTLRAKLSFNANGTLRGKLYSHDSYSLFRAQGDGIHWSVFDFGADAFSGSGYCVGDNLCDAGTGYWQIDPATIPTPAPRGLFGLAALGILGLWIKRFRARC